MKTKWTEREQMALSTKQPDDRPSIPFRYLRRNRKVYYPDGTRETDDHDDEAFFTQAETVLQWLDPDGVWRDVPTVEETETKKEI